MTPNCQRSPLQCLPPNAPHLLVAIRSCSQVTGYTWRSTIDMTLHTNRDGETIELNNGNADLVVGTTRCAQVAAGYRPLNRSAQGPSFDCPLIAVRNVPIQSPVWLRARLDRYQVCAADVTCSALRVSESEIDMNALMEQVADTLGYSTSHFELTASHNNTRYSVFALCNGRHPNM